MGFEIPRALGVGAVQPNIYPRPKNTYFGNTLNADTFENTSIDRFTTEPAIKRMIESNPKVKNIVKNYKFMYSSFNNFNNNDVIDYFETTQKIHKTLQKEL